MTDIADPVPALIEAYRAAVFAKDVDAFVALYDRDVRVFDLWAAWSYDGLDAWRGMVVDWFASLGDETVEVEFADVRTTVSRDLVVAHAFAAYAAIDVDGGRLRAMDNRLTWMLRRRGDAWTIVHEHTSAPVVTETAKAMLRR